MRDLAEAVPEFRVLTPELPIGYSPVPGATRLVSAAEVARLASANHVVLPVSASACFKRKVQALNPDSILHAMKTALPEGSVELIDFSRSPVPVGEIEFPADRLGRASIGNPEAPVLWRGVVKDAQRSYPVWARVKVIMPPAPVTRGSKVTVRALSGTAHLSFEATAESAGRTGEIVSLRNPWNGRRFHGRVEGVRKVVVE